MLNKPSACSGTLGCTMMLFTASKISLAMNQGEILLQWWVSLGLHFSLEVVNIAGFLRVRRKMRKKCRIAVFHRLPLASDMSLFSWGGRCCGSTAEGLSPWARALAAAERETQGPLTAVGSSDDCCGDVTVWINEFNFSQLIVRFKCGRE